MAEKPVQATLKMGAGYDAPWVTISGTYQEVEENLTKIIESTLGELIAEASQRVQGAFLLIGKSPATGGVGAQTTRKRSTKAAAAVEAATGEPTTTEEPATEAAPAVEQDPIEAALNAASTKAELAGIWAKNQAALKAKPELMEIMKARSAALA